MNERTNGAHTERFHQRKLRGGGSQRRWRTVLLSVLQQLDGVCRDGVRTEDGGFLDFEEKGFWGEPQTMVFGATQHVERPTNSVPCAQLTGKKAQVGQLGRGLQKIGEGGKESWGPT
jgi:hypothetical protein